jgi:gamma-glutamyltranspeptidase/glutathione hydrolase
MTPAEEKPFESDPVREASMYNIPLGRPAVKDNADMYGYKAAAIPGFVKGMSYLIDQFGSLELDEILQPAIRYAEGGFLIDLYIAKTIAFNMYIISRFPETARILLKDGYPPNPWGDSRVNGGFHKLVQKDLASTLKKIAKDGSDAYYRGEIATSIADDMSKNGGYINESDLAAYEPQILEPSEGSYRDYEMYSLPVSTTIMQILHILDCFDMKEMGLNTVESIHVLIEAIKLTFDGRKEFLGWGVEDPPFKGIVSKGYAQTLATQIEKENVLDTINLGDPRLFQDDETTHACSVDKKRNVVGIHSSLGDAFGCKVTVKGTGIILNNKMKGYDPRPGKPDSVKPRIIKPPPSGSTILVKDEKPYLVIGSPGGYKQVCAVARSIHSFIDYKIPIREAIATPRVFVQSGKTFIDSRMPTKVCNTLAHLGHDIVVVDREFGFARPNAIVIDPNTGFLHGGIDGELPKGLDQVTLGY